MSEPTVVQIDATKRKKIVQAALQGVLPYDLRDESPEKLEVTDNEIRWFLDQLSAADQRKLSEGQYGRTFINNSNAALKRLDSLKPKRQGWGRVAGKFLDFDEKEVSPDRSLKKFAGDK